MKLVRYARNGGARVGVVLGQRVLDLTDAGCAFTSIEAIIEGGSKALDQLADLSAHQQPQLALSDLSLLAPVAPRKYLGIGMNYRAHVKEAEKLGFDEPKKQLWFNKQITCLSGPYDVIEPGVTEQLDYEVELGVVIGKKAKSVSICDASQHIFGYVVANDVSARDWQFHSPTFTVGKSFDTHGPVGPWIVTSDEIPDPHSLDLRCFVNGTLRQSANTSQMIHNVYEQIAYLSTAFTLEPGDLLATGTPGGVGISHNPPLYLQPGDLVRCEIDGIGAISNRVARR